MSQNTFIHGLVRPAVRAVAAHTGLTPNHLTTLRLTTGLAAAMIFAQGTDGWVSIIGGLIFLLSMLLDRADGELARYTNQLSVAGHRYDLVSDCVVDVSTFIGIGIGVEHTVGLNAHWLGALAGLGIGVLFLELNLMNLASVRGHDLFGGLDARALHGSHLLRSRTFDSGALDRSPDRQGTTPSEAPSL